MSSTVGGCGKLLLGGRRFSLAVGQLGTAPSGRLLLFIPLSARSAYIRFTNLEAALSDCV